MAKRHYTTNLPEFHKCSVEGCERKHAARGLCSRHYDKAKVRGTLGPLSRVNKTEQFLQALVGHQGQDCVEWPYHRNKKGYGWANVGGKQNSASRWMCVLAHGEAPFAGAEAAHRCGNRGCVNPNHVRWSTPKENMADQYAHGTRVFGESIKRAVLNGQLAEEIWKSRFGPAVWSRRLGCSPQTIQAIQSGKTWLHITASLGPRGRAANGKLRDK